MKIGIIGAGISGLVLADQLKSKGVQAQVFEKARGVSGRMSTRYADQFEFDHGAQFLTASDPDFKKFVDQMVRESVLEEWTPRTCEIDRYGGITKTTLSKKLYVAKPRMNSLARHLAENLDVQVGLRIEKIEKKSSGWTMLDQQGQTQGPYDFVISTAPAPQTNVLFEGLTDHLDQILGSDMQGAFTVMLGFDQPLETPFEMARPINSLLSTITLNSSKPGRPNEGQCWVLQSENSWSEVHMEDEKSDVMAAMINEAIRLTGLSFDQAEHKDIHRWRYAIAQNPLGLPYILDHSEKLGMCGDWCAQNKIEGAFLSALKLSDRINL